MLGLCDIYKPVIKDTLYKYFVKLILNKVNMSFFRLSSSSKLEGLISLTLG